MFVRPHLAYGDVIYHIPQSKSIFDSSISLHPLMERIEQVQYQAALAITGCWHGSNRNKIYDEVGWETLSDRRWSRRLVQLFKIRNDMTPQYLKNNLPPLQTGSSRYNDVTKYREIPCNTTRYLNSFFPDSIRSWNFVGVDFSSTLSIAVFKKNLKNLIRPKPRPIFGISDSMGIKFIFQLRLGLSPLKFHEKKHNFLDTPEDLCDCRSACEDTAHFLFTCDIHNVARVSLRTTVLDILLPRQLQHLISNTELYLYGHSSLSRIENKGIVLSTIKFIKESNRFS